MLGTVVDQAFEEVGAKPGRGVDALEAPERNGKENHAEVHAATKGRRVVGRVRRRSRGRRWAGRPGTPARPRLLAGAARGLDVLVEGVEAGVMNQVEAPAGLVGGPGGELDVLLQGGRGLRHEERAPKAVLDLEADVVADRRLR